MGIYIRNGLPSPAWTWKIGRMPSAVPVNIHTLMRQGEIVFDGV